VNFPPGVLAPEFRAILVLVAAAVALTATVVWTAGPAGASSGGTSVSGKETDGGDKYLGLWDGASRHNKRWARQTAECESGKNPDAIGGGGKYRGAFQFMRQTWRQAPKSPGGDPIDYNFKTQAVVAVYLKKREGTGAWPNCG
jgi:hypothetical protein